MTDLLTNRSPFREKLDPPKRLNLPNWLSWPRRASICATFNYFDRWESTCLMLCATYRSMRTPTVSIWEGTWVIRRCIHLQQQWRQVVCPFIQLQHVNGQVFHSDIDTYNMVWHPGGKVTCRSYPWMIHTVWWYHPVQHVILHCTQHGAGCSV